MNEATSNLKLPFIMPSQAQKHVTHNEALRTLDTVIQLSVLNDDKTTPPENSKEGDRHIIPPNATGLWQGKGGQIAAYRDGIWVFYQPQDGWLCTVLSDGGLLVRRGEVWENIDVGNGAADVVENLGVNGTADEINRLVVASQASLFNHDGEGHCLKVNKQNSTNTASVIFQTGFSGRAEMGTTGSDDFQIKVTDDGTAWKDALLINKQTGQVAFPSGGVRELLSGPRTYHVHPTLGNDANDGLAQDAGAFKTLQHAVNVVSTVDGNGNTVTIQLADGEHATTSTISFNRPTVGVKELRVIGNISNPENVVLTSSAYLLVLVSLGRVEFRGIKLATTGSGNLLTVRAPADVQIGNIDFSTSNRFHMDISGGNIDVIGPYTMSGEASRHVNCAQRGSYSITNQTVTLSGDQHYAFEFMRVAEGALITIWNTTFTGLATGRRYRANTNAMINTSGRPQDYLPGNIAGAVGSGGLYV